MDATHIEDVIGEFVSLKKRGANHIGCCPFHNEKTPSFYVSPSKGIFKCFGCGKSGNAVGFLMEHEHYSYPEALRYLARKYNIPIEEEEMTEEQKERQNERDGLFHVSEFAQKYFADLLYNDEMGRAIGLSYFHQRGMSDEIIKTFGLGYCKEGWSDFTDHARRNGYSDLVLEKTGLTIFSEDGKVYDRFRGRVMFPIFSISGRVMGFSGRVLSKEKQLAKYVNSPDSEIYNKSHILYGLFQAKNAISKANKCYLVEGNVDVVSMHQSGVCNTVASCGTSLTNEQIRLIKRYTPNVTVLYDGDSAGIKAALRAVNLLFEEGMHVRVVLFPDGEDPDSYAQKYGSTQLQEYLATHEENFVKFKSRVLLDDVQNDPIRKTEVLKEIVQTIALVPDMLERQEYISETAFKLHMSEQVLTQELAKTMAIKAQKAWKEENRRQQQAATQQAPAPQDPGVPPPLMPEEEDYGPATIGPGHTAPTQILPSYNPAEAQEKQLISLLLNYGSRKVTIETLDDNGQEQPAEATIAEVIVDEVCGDELKFDNPVYQTIFDLFSQAVDSQQPLPDANLFAMHEDNMVRNTALSLMINSYTVSKQWYEKKHIAVPCIETHLREDLDQSILTFKQKKVDQLLEANSYRIRESKTPEDTDLLLAERKQLTEIRRLLCQKLNRVIV
jgi:DNA primase